MADDFWERYGSLLAGSYDCPDRIVLNAAWGHMVIKMSGHPPFGAQIILNGHEYVAIAAQGEGICFTKEGNCFTQTADPQHLARVADALPREAAEGRLGQACDRWIYTACLCFGLDLAEQERSGFRYGYSVYQAEYSRNLLFRSGGQMEALFDRAVDRARSRLDVRRVRTIFGIRQRKDRAAGPPVQEIVTETPKYGLTWFRSASATCRSRPTPKASTSCGSRLPSTTPGICGAAATWTTSPRS